MKTTDSTIAVPKLILNGKDINEKEMVTVSSDIQHAVMLSAHEIVAFTDDKHFDEWMRQSSVGKQYLNEKNRMKGALEIHEIIGSDRAFQLLANLHKKLDGAAESMKDLAIELAKHDQTLQMQDMAYLYKTVLSPKAGSVFFYKDPNYRNSFNEWQGFFHISNSWVGKDNNDRLSSIKAYAAIQLFEHKSFRGRSVFLAGLEVRDFSVSQWSWFDNMMSSYWFWA